MSQYPFVARVYIGAVIATAVAVTAIVLAWQWPLLASYAGLIVVLGIAAGLTEFFPTELRRGNDITVTTVIYIFSIVGYPGSVAVAVSAVAGIIYALFGRTARHKALFNAAQYTLTVAIGAALHGVLADDSPLVFSSVRDVAALLVAGFVYFLINTGFVSLVVALTQQVAFVYVWRANYLKLSLYYLGMLPAGCVLAVLWHERPILTPLAIALAFLIHRLFSVAITLEEQTTRALVAMADIIDQRDPYTYNHCQHVAQWAERIAHQLKLPDDDIEILMVAARLHDIGKIGIPNEVLLKPGHLSPEEWATVRQHPEVGERILRFFPRFQEGLSYIRHHHERYDGRGYPDGLRGEDIPLASRILCVADSLSAMLDRRPYKPALSLAEAMAELKRCSAEQFDPVVVGATLVLLAAEQRQAEDENYVPTPVIALEQRSAAS
jgi:putative nucleotidyltransferase with HDIG domain